MMDFAALSQANLKKIDKTLEIILDAYQIQTNSFLYSVKIPFATFETEGISRFDVRAIMGKLCIKEVDFNPFDELAGTAAYYYNMPGQPKIEPDNDNLRIKIENIRQLVEARKEIDNYIISDNKQKRINSPNWGKVMASGLILKNLKLKFEPLKDHKNDLEFFNFRFDYVDFICGNSDLAPLITKLNNEGKLYPRLVQRLYNDYMIIPCLRDYPDDRRNHFVFPKFYNQDFEKAFNLHKNYCQLTGDDYEITKNNLKLLKIDGNLRIVDNRNQDKYYADLQRLNIHLLEELSAQEASRLNQATKIDLNKDIPTQIAKTTERTKKITNKRISKAKYGNGILKFRGKDIDFNSKENQRELLKTLFEKPTRNWSYDEIQDEWDETMAAQTSKPKNYWRKFYTAGDGINGAIAKKTLIEDFLIKDTKEIKINPKYI